MGSWTCWVRGFAGVALLALLAGACGDSEDPASGDDTAALDGSGDASDHDADAGVIDPGCTLEMEGQPCDDADPCTTEDICQGGRCVGGGTLACDDPDPCRTGRCEAGTGCVYEPLDEGASCSLACFTSATCEGGHCTPAEGSAKPCPEPSDPCVDRLSCDSATGLCSVPIYAPAGTECDRDGDLCTIDQCDGAGACEDTLQLETCAALSSNNPCWTYACVKASGCVRGAFVAGASCDDLNPCTGGDTCLVNAQGQQTCLGTPLPIDDGNPCTNDSCADGAISHIAIDGIVCTQPDDLCVGQGICEAGECKTQPAVDCDDHDPCTVDSCAPATGACGHAPATDGTLCDDANPCTSLDRCAGGLCAGTPVANCCGNGACETGEGCECADCEGEPCDSGALCTTGDTCQGGRCVGTALSDCCGNGACEAGEGCGCPDCEGEPCDDGDACTTGETCQGALCVSAGVVPSCCGNGLCELGEGCGCADCEDKPCSDGNTCTQGDTCGAGVCQPGAPLANCCGNGACEDGEGCGCADCEGQSCDDSNACTTGETCAGGVCQGGGVLAFCCGNQVCEEGEGCECGDCEGEPCDDGAACTVGDTCAGGSCQSGALSEGCCGNQVCDPGEGCGCADCEGEPCEDGNTCTTQDTCGAGVCQPGALVDGCCGNGVCEDGEGCGCADCEGQPCEDGDVCTTGDLCVAGLCVSGAPLVPCCGDGICDGGEGCDCSDCQGQSCSDDNPCTEGDICEGGLCAGAAVADCCATAANTCDAHASCTDTGGGISCECEPGYAGDGHTCGEDVRPDNLALVAGSYHLCLLEDGVVRCWGSSGAGYSYGSTETIGDDEQPSVAGPVQLGGYVDWLEAGSGVTCAKLTAGPVRCWGANNHGQLGLGHTEKIGDDELPTAAPFLDLGGEITAIDVGSGAVCAVRADGALFCWGSNDHGKLGLGHTRDIGDDELPFPAGLVDAGGPVKDVTLGGNHTCALLRDGSVRCWGGYGVNDGYAIDEIIGDDELPSSVGPVSLGGPVREIVARHQATCAIMEAGQVRCWGYNDAGQLGLGNKDFVGDDEVPSSVPYVSTGGPGAVTQIGLGERHACALFSEGGVRCWGSGLFGRLGYNNETTIGDNELPSSRPLVPIGGAVAQLAKGMNLTCVLLTDGHVRCWGLRGAYSYGHTTNIGDGEGPSIIASGDVQL